MTTIEDRLRHLGDGYDGQPDLAEGLLLAVTSGRTKRRLRVGAGAGIAGAAVALVVGVGLASVPDRVPSIEPVLPSPATEDDRSPTPASTPTPTPAPSASASEVPAVASTATPNPTEEPSRRPSPSETEPVVDDFPTPTMLELSVSTDRDTYAAGDQVVITVEACNGTSGPIDEYFFEEGDRYTLRVVTRDDRRAVADTSGREYDGEAVTETWQPGECRSWTEVWDQREGRFDEPGGQQAESGQYEVWLDWHGVPPPSPEMDPRLYDPPGRDGAASDPFTIEDDGLLSGGE